MTVNETMQIEGIWLNVQAEYTKHSPATLEQPEEPEGYEIAGVYLLPTDGTTKPLGANILPLLSEYVQDAITDHLWESDEPDGDDSEPEDEED